MRLNEKDEIYFQNSRSSLPTVSSIFKNIIPSNIKANEIEEHFYPNPKVYES